MKNVLIIAYEFPPLQRMGAQRPYRMAAHLPGHGFNPVVLTLDEKCYPLVYEKFSTDQPADGRLPDTAVIESVKSGNILRLYKSPWRRFLNIYLSLVSREAYRWRKDFREKIRAAVARYRPVAVIATVPPFSMAPLAVRVSEQYDLPLILDLRDPWSQWVVNPYGSRLHYLLTRRLEKRCLRKAAAVTVATDQMQEDYRRLYPHMPSGKIHEVMNGYEQKPPAWTVQHIDPGKQEIVIGYVGSFYYSPGSRENMFRPWWKKRFHRMLQYVPHREDWLYRTPWFFFRAVRSLMDKHPEWEQRLKLKFAGPVGDWMNAMVKECGLEHCVETLGTLPRGESLTFQSSCDALLITSLKKIGGDDYCIAGKSFEYITMGKPIIAFVCRGSQQRFLEKTGMALICDPDATDESAAYLHSLLSGKMTFTPDASFLDTLSAEQGVAKLAGIIRNVTQHTC